MRPLALALFAPTLTACALHIHVHEAPRPVVQQAAVTPAHSSHEEGSALVTVSGSVRDGAGEPVRARVAAVSDGGSVAVSTDKQGRFTLSGLYSPNFVLHASMDDGQVAVQPCHTGAPDIELVLLQGGTLVIDLVGREKTRCAIFADQLRIEDFTLKSSEPARVAVPAGEVRVRLYEGDQTLQERHFSVAAGKVEIARFDLKS